METPSSFAPDLDVPALVRAAREAARTGAPFFQEELRKPELDGPRDKYALRNLPEIDCAARLHLCRARCCKMSFALSRQDVEEQVVQWESSRPYRIARRANGACVHLEAGACTVYAQRPGVCRRYDCRGDSRVWLDFEARLPAP